MSPLQRDQFVFALGCLIGTTAGFFSCLYRYGPWAAWWAWWWQ